MKIRLLLLLTLVGMLISCGSSRRIGKADVAGTRQRITLSSEQQRKYDYFFLEATRLKVKKEYDAAFDLLKHCLTIDPYAASALYEISQYYMFLKQVPQGQAALEAAVENAPDNYWYNQALASLYQQQVHKEKAIDILEQWQSVSSEKDALFALIDLYNQKQDYGKVTETLGLSGREARKKRAAYDGEVSYLFANEG